MWTKHTTADGTLWYRVEGPVLESVARGRTDESNPAILTKLLEEMSDEARVCVGGS